MILYKLNNNETIELKFYKETDEDFNTIIIIQAILFNGGITIEYTFNSIEDIDLNQIFADIEKDYKRLRVEDTQHYIDCYTN